MNALTVSTILIDLRTALRINLFSKLLLNCAVNSLDTMHT